MHVLENTPQSRITGHPQCWKSALGSRRRKEAFMLRAQLTPQCVCMSASCLGLDFVYLSLWLCLIFTFYFQLILFMQLPGWCFKTSLHWAIIKQRGNTPITSYAHPSHFPPDSMASASSLWSNRVTQNLKPTLGFPEAEHVSHDFQTASKCLSNPERKRCNENSKPKPEGRISGDLLHSIFQKSNVWMCLMHHR